MRYGVPVANSGRELERLHGVATGQGRVFISRSWRRPQDVVPNSIPIGTPLQSEIIELLPDGSSRLIAAAPTCRWGRIQLSPDYRERVGLDKDVLVIGMLEHFEVWNPERWKHLGEQREPLGELFTRVAQKGV